MQKDLNEKRLCKYCTLRDFESCQVASKSTCSSFPGLLNHKMLQVSWKSIAFSHAVVLYNRGRKHHKTFKIHFPIAGQYLHHVNIMLLELDLRMRLYFFQKNIGYIIKIMFELLYILQNWSIFPKSCDYAIFCSLCDRMWQEVNCVKLHQRIISESLIYIDNVYIHLIQKKVTCSNSEYHAWPQWTVGYM